MKRCVAILASLLFFQPVAASAADRDDPAAAQSLFYEARALMSQGKYADACPKLEESKRLDHGIGTAFNLADCYEHVGKIATAWAGFLDVAAEAKAKNQLDREKVARKRAQALEARLPKLFIEVEDRESGLEVTRDGIFVGAAQWGTAIPVDPGTHTIVATAPGKVKWTTKVTTPESRPTKVTLPRALVAAPTVATAPAGTRRPPEPTSTTTTTSDLQAAPPVQTYRDFPEPVDDNRGSAQRTLGWIVAGAGVAGLAVGAGFGVVSIEKRNDARAHCNGDVCDEGGVALRNDAIRAGNIATASAIGGGAALVGGVLLVLTAPSGPKRSGILAVPQVAMNGGGILLQGPLP